MGHEHMSVGDHCVSAYAICIIGGTPYCNTVRRLAISRTRGTAQNNYQRIQPYSLLGGCNASSHSSRTCSWAQHQNVYHQEAQRFSLSQPARISLLGVGHTIQTNKQKGRQAVRQTVSPWALQAIASQCHLYGWGERANKFPCGRASVRSTMVQATSADVVGLRSKLLEINCHRVQEVAVVKSCDAMHAKGHQASNSISCATRPAAFYKQVMESDGTLCACDYACDCVPMNEYECAVDHHE